MRLYIEEVKNGFKVNTQEAPQMIGDEWVFETAQGLSDFVIAWGVELEVERINRERERDK